MITMKKRKFRVDILTIFSTLLLLTCFTIIVYSYVKNTKAIIQIANHLILRTHTSIAEKLNDYLYPTSLIEVSKAALGDEIIKVSELSELDGIVHMMLNANPQLRNMYVADTQGNIYIENRVPLNPAEYAIIPFIKAQDVPLNTAFISQIIIHDNNKAKLTTQFQGADGKNIKTIKNKSINFDPRSRPWYVGALKNTENYWIGIYSFIGTQQEGITVSSPIKVGKKIVGVMGVDMDIDAVTRFLNAINIGHHSIVFISNAAGKIIAYEGEVISKHEVPDISRISNPIIKAAYFHFKSTQEKNFTFKEDGVDYLAIFTPYAFGTKDTWQIATIAPMNDFIGISRITNYQNVIFSVAMLLLGLLFVLFSSNSISHPIVYLANKTKDIQRLKFEDVIKIKTHIYEVQVLADALNATKRALLSFSKYVPKILVAQLIKSGTIAQLGGERKTITVTFSDIVNFTALSESLPPEIVMLHLSEYLNIVTETIHQFNGNVDKYIGDSVMSFWGAPLEDNYHEQNACYAMLAIRHALSIKNKEWQTSGKPVFLTRIGINTGEAVVGNMGSSDRLNYTVIGDVVNLAARLEGLNKIYGTEIMVTQKIFDLCQRQFLFRPIDIVKIRGKQLMIPIYELMGAIVGPDYLLVTDDQKALANLSRAAYDAYHHQEIDQAIELFKEILKQFPDDGMAKYYLSHVE